MAQLPLTLSSFQFGTIATIAKPETISSISELPDLKIMVKETGGPYKPLYFQLSFTPTIRATQHPRAEAERMSKQIWQETRAKSFRVVHGDCVKAPQMEKGDPEATRMVDTLERLIKHSGMRPIIMGYPYKDTYHHEFGLKLPRGIYFRMYHSLILSSTGPSNRQHDGIIAIGGDRYYYYLWRPVTIRREDIPNDVLFAEIVKAFRESFPFVALSGFQMFPNIDTLKIREGERKLQKLEESEPLTDPTQE